MRLLRLLREHPRAFLFPEDRNRIAFLEYGTFLQADILYADVHKGPAAYTYGITGVRADIADLCDVSGKRIKGRTRPVERLDAGRGWDFVFLGMCVIRLD